MTLGVNDIQQTSIEFYYCQCRYAERQYAECHYAECRYAECHYSECHYSECRGTKCKIHIESILAMFRGRAFYLDTHQLNALARVYKMNHTMSFFKML